jgi:hypothetical protein
MKYDNTVGLLEARNPNISYTAENGLLFVGAAVAFRN